MGKGSLQQTHWCPQYQQPTKLGDLGNIGQNKLGRLVWIEPQRQQVHRGFQRILLQLGPITDRRQRVEIRHEIERQQNIPAE